MSESNKRRPLVSVAIRPKTKDDGVSLQRALSDIAQQDGSLRITELVDGQTKISGMGDLHLEVICDRILHEYGVRVDIDEPKVIYLETIRKPAEAEGRYMRQAGGRGHYAHVKIRIEPREQGSGYQFVDKITEGAVRTLNRSRSSWRKVSWRSELPLCLECWYVLQAFVA